MSESLKSWLFVHCSTSSISALSANYDLSDMPYLSGNRVQLLRFLTFRPASSPNSVNTDVWALVGDRTHCIAALFSKDQINKFHLNYPITFTSLKGALLTLTNVRITVARVQVDQALHSSNSGRGGGLPYRQGQYALVLNVKGFEVVSSLNEPVWFGGVKVVTSLNGVPIGQEEGGKGMLRWLKKWVRYKSLLRKARIEAKEQKRKNEVENEQSGPNTNTTTTLPTPAQRRRAVLVPSSSQAQNSQQMPPPAPQPVSQNKVWQPSTMEMEQIFPTSTNRSSEDDVPLCCWEDFDLDTEVNLDHVEMPQQWVASSSSATQPREALVVGDELQPPQAALQQTQEPSQTQASTQTQTQTQSDLDPYESGLSDYERETRLKRRRAKEMSHPSLSPAVPTRSPIPPTDGDAEEHLQPLQSSQKPNHRPERVDLDNEECPTTSNARITEEKEAKFPDMIESSKESERMGLEGAIARGAAEIVGGRKKKDVMVVVMGKSVGSIESLAEKDGDEDGETGEGKEFNGPASAAIDVVSVTSNMVSQQLMAEISTVPTILEQPRKADQSPSLQPPTSTIKSSTRQDTYHTMQPSSPPTTPPPPTTTTTTSAAASKQTVVAVAGREGDGEGGGGGGGRKKRKRKEALALLMAQIVD